VKHYSEEQANQLGGSLTILKAMLMHERGRHLYLY
jgi:hypothetical protein